jgi:hypothetical protein
MKQVIVIAAAALAGFFARDVLVSKAEAEEEIVRRVDVQAIVRALEMQARAAEKQVDATRELGRSVSEVGRRCR